MRYCCSKVAVGWTRWYVCWIRTTANPGFKPRLHLEYIPENSPVNSLKIPCSITWEIVVRRWLLAGRGGMCVGYEWLQTQASKRVCTLNIHRKTHLRTPWRFRAVSHEISLFKDGCWLDEVVCVPDTNGCKPRLQNVFAPWIYTGKHTCELPNDSMQYHMRYCLSMMRMNLDGGVKNRNINNAVLGRHFGHAPRLHICDVAREISSETMENWVRYDDLKLQPKKKWKMSRGHTHVKNTVMVYI